MPAVKRRQRGHIESLRTERLPYQPAFRHDIDQQGAKRRSRLARAASSAGRSSPVIARPR